MSNVFVAVRLRPLIPREIDQSEVEVIQCKNQTVLLRQSLNQPHDDVTVYNTYKFTFDTVFDKSATQQQVYQQAVEPTVQNFTQGYNGCIMAYGQTGSGKTHTIMSDSFDGVIPATINDVFKYIEQMKSRHMKNSFLLCASYYQIYNENVLDLLNPTSINLRIRETPAGQIYVENIEKALLTNPIDLEKLIRFGNQNRFQAETKMNTNSSRSHSILTLYLDQNIYDAEDLPSVTTSKLMILDLAGSERAHSQEKERQRETKCINQSLSILGNVMQQIVASQQVQTHVSFRDSKLTRVLQDSVGGNCKTVIITNISPASACFFETLNSLKFADRAKSIQQHAQINQIEDDSIRRERLLVEIQHAKDVLAQGGLKGTQEELYLKTQLEKQLEDLREKERNPRFAEFQRLYEEIRRLDERRSGLQNQQEELQQLRGTSLKHRDVLLVLTAKLQSKEHFIQEQLKHISEGYKQIQALEDRTSDLPDVKELVDKVNIANIIPQLTFEQKIDELVALKEDLSAENAKLEIEWKQLKSEIVAKQEELDNRVKSIQKQKLGAVKVNYLSECLKERDLLIQIFKTKICGAVASLVPGDSQQSRALSVYFGKIRDYQDNSEIRLKLQELFE